MRNSQPYCELKKFVFDAKDAVKNPYLQVRWVYKQKLFLEGYAQKILTLI